MKINRLLENNSYPGRGIVIGNTPDGKYAVVLYFITGRSLNSRNRIFCGTEDGIRTEAYDPLLMSDPSLVIYTPVCQAGDTVIVTNGAQTNTVYEYLMNGKSFEDAIRTWAFEPDPMCTPRISGVLYKDGSYKLSILKSQDFNPNPKSTLKFFFEYQLPVAGKGHFISTYKQDGDPVPSFEGEPIQIDIAGDIREMADGVWQSLHEENKVSLFVLYTGLENGERNTLIYNKNGKGVL